MIFQGESDIENHDFTLCFDVQIEKTEGIKHEQKDWSPPI